MGGQKGGNRFERLDNISNKNTLSSTRFWSLRTADNTSHFLYRGGRGRSIQAARSFHKQAFRRPCFSASSQNSWHSSKRTETLRQISTLFEHDKIRLLRLYQYSYERHGAAISEISLDP